MNNYNVNVAYLTELLLASRPILNGRTKWVITNGMYTCDDNRYNTIFKSYEQVHSHTKINVSHNNMSNSMLQH